MTTQPTKFRIHLLTTPTASRNWRTVMRSTGASLVIHEQADALTLAHLPAIAAQCDMILIDIDHLFEQAEKNLPAFRQAYPYLPFVAIAQVHRRGLLDALYRNGMRGYSTYEIGAAAFAETLATIMASPNAFVVRIGG